MLKSGLASGVQARVPWFAVWLAKLCCLERRLPGKGNHANLGQPPNLHMGMLVLFRAGEGGGGDLDEVANEGFVAWGLDEFLEPCRQQEVQLGRSFWARLGLELQVVGLPGLS